MRLLIDTNVYLEHILEREKCEVARTFFKTALSRKNQLVITSMSFRDIEYVYHKKSHDRELTRRMLSSICSTVYKIIPTTADAAIASIYNDVKDFEDSLQIVAAEEAMCDAIVTFNKKDFELSKVPVFTPEQMCEIWRKENR